MGSEILLYQTETGDTNIEVRLENENVWLSQVQMATLYQTTKQNISLHLKNIYKEGELNEDLTVKDYLTVQQEGSRSVQRALKYYNLDAIISVGYRVDSHRGTQFRIWATKRLREYLVKGFILDDERLKSNNQPNYFQELIDRIRDIRSTEAIFYQKVKEIYATSIDYDSSAQTTIKFFASVQNKLHWAVHQHTAAELIADRADAKKPNMGLTTYNSDKVRRTDVTVAKNYLNEMGLKELNLLVEQYLAFAEAQALQQRPMYMKDWASKLHDILTINQKEIKMDAGRIKKKIADEMALREYEKFDAGRKAFNASRNFKSLESEVKKIKQSEKKK